ncbi:DNA polymerase III delta prime subunit [Stella humosa]|uniref:DNA polymerase III delta prime subunit n=1 Tax=Stella humosa TaxID=94 RepID=A0A3N1MEL7_9PROT|nr:DNA polymerase III subunit delta' [Stella humosa]ROQ01585.1 DNA polymerase III delta prime subunit [Stella humosa]BBK31965.1 DNA polymerase III subunit delta' [Stella humosa]
MSEAAPDAFAPVSSPCLFGLEPAERAFLRAWRSGRMPHAWLVTGPRGVGKATLVHRFARFVLSGGDGDAGGLFGDPPDTLAVESPRARHIAAGGHPDLRVVTRGLSDRGKLRQEIVIDDIRDLGHFLHLTPAGGGWRVAIVDAADDLNRNAANALLKVLEEPPRNALLLLTSHSPGRLLPTIRSRCRRLALEPLPPAAVEEGLRAIRPGIADDAVPALVQLAEGSIGRAVSLADMDGVEAYRDLLDLLGQWPRMELPALMGWADRFTRGEGEGFALARELLSGLLARVVALGAGRPLPEAVAGELAVTRRLVEGARLDRWVTLWEKTNDLFARADGLDLDRKHALLSSLLAFETVRSAG